MRDVNRISPFCNKIAEEWAELSDWRFGQLMVNFFSWVKSNYGLDVFYIEDDKMMELFKEFLG